MALNQKRQYLPILTNKFVTEDRIRDLQFRPLDLVIRNHLAILTLFAVTLFPSAMAEQEPNFKDYKGDEEFGKLLITLPLIAEAGGGHLVKLADNSLWLIGVGTTARRDTNSSEIIRQHKMSRLKAQAAAVEFLNGAEVSAICISKELTEIRNNNGKESAIVTETLDETIVTKAKGIVTSLEAIGSWTSQDGLIFYQAIGKKLQ